MRNPIVRHIERLLRCFRWCLIQRISHTGSRIGRDLRHRHDGVSRDRRDFRSQWTANNLAVTLSVRLSRSTVMPSQRSVLYPFALRGEGACVYGSSRDGFNVREVHVTWRPAEHSTQRQSRHGLRFRVSRLSHVVWWVIMYFTIHAWHFELTREHG